MVFLNPSPKDLHSVVGNKIREEAQGELVISDFHPSFEKSVHGRAYNYMSINGPVYACLFNNFENGGDDDDFWKGMWNNGRLQHDGMWKLNEPQRRQYKEALRRRRENGYD